MDGIISIQYHNADLPSKIFAIINTTTTVVAVISIHTSAHQKMIDDDATSGSSICEGCMQYDTRKRDIP